MADQDQSTMASTVRAWQVAAPGSFAKTLKLVTLPQPSQPAAGQILVQVKSAALNPADYKLAEIGFMARAALSFPKIPGMDLSGKVTTVGPNVADVKVGDLIMGRMDPVKGPGSFCGAVTLQSSDYGVVPPGSDIDAAAGTPTTALTGYQCIVPYVKAGDKVFINGGSGGLGNHAVQIAKLMGCHVTTTCSTSKIAQCKELGADEIIDYTKEDVLQKLKEGGQRFSLILDNAGKSISMLYHNSPAYLLPTGQYILLGGQFTMSGMSDLLWAQLRPGFLGGGKNPFSFKLTKQDGADLREVAKWFAEGKLKTMVDSTFEFEDLPKAIDKLRLGSSTGKIVVHVSE